MVSRTLLLALLLALGPLAAAVVRAASPPPSPQHPTISPETIDATIHRVLDEHGQLWYPRAYTGVHQVAERWWREDGDEKAFADFCVASFESDPLGLQKIFDRLQSSLEQVDGHVHEARRVLTEPLDLDTGPLTPLDRCLGDVDLAPQVDEDLFRSKAAFVALLNFSVDTLQTRLAKGAQWRREEWARSAMMDRFAERVPAAVAQEVNRAFTDGEAYISGYNIRLDRLVDAAGRRPFPEGLRLISHWGLRDEIGSRYADPDGLAKQRLIARVMERIVRQEIPRAVIDNPDVTWNPETNRVEPAKPGAPPDPDAAAKLAEREPDTRYAHLLDIFHAVEKEDPFSPGAPTYIQRRFERDRQIPQAEVEALLVAILESSEVKDLSRLVAARLGRPLEPFDIWYSGFRPRGSRSDAELDAIVRRKFATVAAFQAALPSTLGRLGFSPEKAKFLADRIAVDPARGAGHAMPASRREDKARLRTRIPAGGMDYKGYNIAIHELGHNVEQVFSLDEIDFWWLSGVPDNAFTEALAFLFQNRDLEVLGLSPPSAAERRTAALATLWNAYEIAGVSLVDMRVWRWLYDHPQATPAELRQAVLGIAREVWNRYYAPLFGRRDAEILAIYSHMIDYGLYLPDYALGHLIAFQVGQMVRGDRFGAEFERVARQGRITPDAWMHGAVGQPLSAQPLLAAAREALAAEAPRASKGRPR
jgi:hypothetical protein